MVETSDVSNGFYVYVLFSLKDYGFYIGFTRDVPKRFLNHTRGEVRSTRYRRPFVLIHYEYFVNEKDARAREVFLKSGFGRDNLKKALQHTLSFYKSP